MASMFNPMQNNTALPPIPKIDSDEYNQASEEERPLLIEKAVNNDSFWGKFFEKLKDEGSYASLMDATKEVDTQIAELNKKRWDIIKEWAMDKKKD